jgi:hypothetical protein
MTTEEKTLVEGEIVEQQSTPVTGETTKVEGAMTTPDYLAIGSFVLGIINLCAWFVPICGCTLSLVGIGLGVPALKSTRFKWMAVVGIILSSIGLLVSLGNWGYSTWYYMQYPEMNPINNMNW